MTLPRTLTIVALISSMPGCVSAMSQLQEPAIKSERRRACTDYVNKSASFVGQQQGFGVAMGALAGGSLAVGAAVEKPAAKISLLSAAVPLAYLAYNFLSNASSATTSVAGASLALSDNDDAAMWSACWRARAVYWDGRSAGIVAASDSLSKAQQRPTTPQGREGSAYADLATSLVEQAEIDANNAKKAIQEAETKKALATASAPATVHNVNSKAAVTAAENAAKKAKDASAIVQSASKNGDNTEAARQLEEVKAQRETVKGELAKAKAAAALYLSTP